MCTESIRKLSLQVYANHGEALVQVQLTQYVGKSHIGIVTDFGLCTLIDVGPQLLCDCLVADVEQMV